MEINRNTFVPLIALLAITVLTIPTSAQQVMGPVSVTAVVGSYAVFNCTGASTDTVTWFAYTPQSMKLFDSPNNLFGNSVKYSVIVNTTGNLQNTYVLNISALTLNDGGSYGCDRSSWSAMIIANLVVVALPVPQLTQLSGQQTYYPNTPGQNSPTLNVGTPVTMSCVYQYGGPPASGAAISLLNGAQVPQTNMYFGSQFLTTGSNNFYLINSQTQSSIYQATLIWNFTIPSWVAGTTVPFNCSISTVSPFYVGAASLPVNVYGPVTTLQVTQNTNSSVLQYNCSANGFPLPTVSWVPAQGFNNLALTDGQSGIGNATLTPSTYAYQTWNCTASYPSQGVVFWTVYSFNDQANATSSNLNAVNLGVGLGIGLGVPILIALVILVICLMRRKKRSETIIKKEVPPSVVIPAPTKGLAPIYKAAPTNTDKANKRPAEAKNGKPNGLVSPNPDPTSVPLLRDPAGGVHPSGRNSPGFGDLGVRQITGTVPQLDESFNTNRSSDIDKVPVRSSNGSSGYPSSSERHTSDV